MLYRIFGLAISASLMAFGTAEARTICTIITDAKTGKTLVEEGDCKTRVTPASTFKLALGVMGYDAGFLKDEHTPTLPFRKSYVDYGGEAWKQPVDPVRWLKYSVVWYSQQIAKVLGEKVLHDYAVKFDYGNADFSGDMGKNNGLERSWIGSSLKISPREQVLFLAKLVNHQLPVSQRAMDMTAEIAEKTQIADGWTVHGKTGMAYPRNKDDTFDRAHPWGWYVGWAEKGGRTVIFARLVQDEKKMPGSTGVRTKDAILTELPSRLRGN
jgi:beta-lactamase class D